MTSTNPYHQPDHAVIYKYSKRLVHRLETRVTPLLVVYFIIVFLLNPVPPPTLSIYTRSKRMIPSNNSVSVVADEDDDEKASGQCLGTTESTPYLFHHPLYSFVPKPTPARSPV